MSLGTLFSGVLAGVVTYFSLKLAIPAMAITMASTLIIYAYFAPRKKQT